MSDPRFSPIRNPVTMGFPYVTPKTLRTCNCKNTLSHTRRKVSIVFCPTRVTADLLSALRLSETPPVPSFVVVMGTVVPLF